MAMEKFNFGNLPIPPAEYSPEHMRQAFRILELYFNQLDSLTPNQAQSYRADYFYGGEFIGDVTGGDVTADTVTTALLTAIQAYAQAASINTLSSHYAQIEELLNERLISHQIMAEGVYSNYFYGDGRYLNTPYNQFTSDQDQTAAALDVAYAIEMNGDDFPDSISIENDSEITFAIPGIYLVTYSIQFQNTDNSTELVDIWFRYKGNDIPASNSQFAIPSRKSALIPSALIAVTPFTVDVVDPGDYIEIMWHPSSLNVTIQHLPAVSASVGVTPDIPATPSVIVEVQFISAQYPPTQRVAPLSVFGYGKLGTVAVTTNLG